jgi:hypothetical protein
MDSANSSYMKVLTNFVRPGYLLSKPLFLSDGEFLPEGTALTADQLKSFRDSGVAVLEIEASPRVRQWEQVPELNAFMNELSSRFGELDEDRGINMIRCAVEDVYSRFLFDLESER